MHSFQKFVSLPVLMALSAWLHAAVAAPAPVIKVGQTVKVSLKKDAGVDYVIGLPKGSFLVLCDTQAAAEANVVQGSLKLLKSNGAESPAFSGSLLSWYEFNSVFRDGKLITLKKPMGARLRLRNSTLSDATMWVTVLPSPVKKFQAFGFGATVTPAKTGANNGTGSTFKADENRFYRVSLPAGQWDISVGARPVGDAYVNANLRILDVNGLATNFGTANAESSSGEEARGEVTITLKKPAMLLLQTRNRSNNGGALEHDVTISKASE